MHELELFVRARVRVKGLAMVDGAWVRLALWSSLRHLLHCFHSLRGLTGVHDFLTPVVSTISHASGKIKNHYFRILSMGSDVFFDADSESPHMT